jgi:preprotein translocase subunit SecA
VRHAPLTLAPDSATLWPLVASEAEAVARAGRAVLVGTETVAQSEALSAVLAGRGLAHRVLHARQDRGESELVAAAGQPGCITVATSMAGRGTDIACAPEVLEQGGLHVILCQLNASARIDRQFAGRAGRQGQPGSVHRMAALDFPLLRRWWPAGWLRWLARRRVPGVVAFATVALAQARQSFTERNERVKLCRVVAAEERDLTFSRQVQHANR